MSTAWSRSVAACVAWYSEGDIRTQRGAPEEVVASAGGGASRRAPDQKALRACTGGTYALWSDTPRLKPGACDEQSEQARI